jgi:uncharacterized phage protein (TIGR01671 family)
MREIKFRYWDGESCYISETLAHNVELFVNPDVKEIMQYVGLKDKNGKEIYEGDFVKWLNVVGNPYTIKYCEAQFMAVANTRWKEQLPIYEFTGREMEVIGNIYENPELLEVKG